MTSTARPLLLAFCLSLAAGPAFALKVERLARFSPASGKTTYLEVAAGSAIVRFKPGISTPAAAAALAGMNFSIVRDFPEFNFSQVSFQSGMTVGSALALLRSNPAVESAAPNRVFRPKRVPGDPFVGTQYALSIVQAFGAWEYEVGNSSRVTVAVIDTGIQGTHPDLSGKLVGTSRHIDPDNPASVSNDPPLAACNHGTRVAGVAAAASDNGAGVAGMSWGAKLISMRIFNAGDCYDDCSDEAGVYSCTTSEAAIAVAISELIPLHNTAALGKIVVNMSIGSVGSCSDSAPYPLQTTVNSAVAAGLLLFAATGNEYAGYMDSPANCSGVYSVGATDSSDFVPAFSNSDPDMRTKGLAAPGVGIYTTDIGGGYASATGTSFATPMTAGLAALVWSARSDFTLPSQVFDVLKNSADDLGPAGPDNDYGLGRINAMKALRLAVTGTEQFPGTRKAVAYPNPFRPKTDKRVTFTVPEQISASGLEVKVYTSEGELVKKLDAPSWDGRNEAGVMVASGVYLFRVKTDKDSAVGRFALLK